MGDERGIFLVDALRTKTLVLAKRLRLVATLAATRFCGTRAPLSAEDFALRAGFFGQRGGLVGAAQVGVLIFMSQQGNCNWTSL